MMTHCPCCRSDATQQLVLTPPLPTNACALVFSPEESLKASRGRINLHGCSACGFMWNRDFDETLVSYDQDYESTQSHSAFFRNYLQETAQEWIAKAPQADRILEVGCGQGEFLAVLEQYSAARLVGYDPAYRGEPHSAATIYPQELPSASTDLFDLVANKMTLEHVADPAGFIENMSHWVSERGMLITQIPNSTRMIEDALYCDLIYEHSNYFTPASLEKLLSQAGFAQTEFETSYSNQHLTAFSTRARTTDAFGAEPHALDFGAFEDCARSFSDTWGAKLRDVAQTCSAIYIWGSGSRATTFINSIPDASVIAGAIDINPDRRGSYVLGAPCKTHEPSALAGQNDVAFIVMNPIYMAEIGDMLSGIMQDYRLLPLE